MLTGPCRRDLRLDRFAAALPYSHPIVRASIDALKYEGIRDLAQPLGSILASAMEGIGPLPDDRRTLLVPVPLHPRRLRERGFNQSALIARVAATVLNLPCAENLIRRTVNTRQQAKLERAARQRNVEGVFAAKLNRKLSDHAIIIVDDVATTGATLREVASALRRAGAREIFGVTVAQG